MEFEFIQLAAYRLHLFILSSGGQLTSSEVVKCSNSMSKRWA